jgi:hypothetical protein
MNRPLVLPAVSICLLFYAPVAGIGLLAAQASDATVAPENIDANYPLVGEFVGPVEVKPREYEPVAVQVRAMGDGSFEAVQYLGGLPGEKGHKKKLKSLLGQRSGDFLILSGGPWALLVHQQYAIVVNQEGERIGRLERIVRESPTLGAPPPKDAVVLFNGEDTNQFTKAKMTEDGLLMQGADFKPMFQDYNMHLEFLVPYKPQGRGQDRGNSGLYLQSRYEVQIFDSFAEPPTNNGLGALYRYREPDVNMALPPSTWQTYDIQFTAPRWAAGGEKIRHARITVWLNGVKVHDNVELENKTGAGKPEEPTLLPTRLQDHGNPVHFRNIWVIDRGLSPAGSFPAYPPKDAAAKQQKPEPAKKDPSPPAKENKTKAPQEKKTKAPQEEKPAPAKPKKAEPAEPEKATAETEESTSSEQDKPKPKEMTNPEKATSDSEAKNEK